MKKAGVLGGTFDPFHYGHLALAQSALRGSALDKVILLPSYIQPFKVGKKTAQAMDRVNMARLIADEYPGFLVCTDEAFSREISYTYRTLRRLRGRPYGGGLSFILGADSFLSITGWYEAEKLIREFPLIIGGRPGFREEEVKSLAARLRSEFGADISFLNNEILEISSTEIKERIREGRSISGMVPGSVERYIFEHGLYK